MSIEKAVWIRAAGEVLPHQFSQFRRRVDLPVAAEAVLRVSADSDFVAYWDGRELMRGQFSDYPAEKTYSEIRFRAEAGTHLLFFDVYYCGIDFSTGIRGDAGFWAEFEAGDSICGSTPAWEARINPAFLRDRLDKLTSQLGMVVGYDARCEEDESGWCAAVESARRGRPVPRPVPLLVNREPVPGRLIRRGSLRRESREGSYAEQVAADRYGDSPGNGFWFLYDLGSEYAGLIETEVDLPPGTVVDISHGEHIADGRVRNRIGDRNFTDRYIAGAGRRRWTLRRRVGARYLQLNVIPPDPVREVGLPRIALRPTELELPPPAEFDCDSVEACRLYRNSVRTLQLCMHEHYEDTPWREQSLYGCDSRNQMLFGYTVWGNYGFAAESLRLLARGQRRDGFLTLTAPSLSGPPIPAFSMIWVVALWEHYLYSGSRAVFDSCREQALRVAETVLALRDAETGLIQLPASGELWHFYEWCDGLEGNRRDSGDSQFEAPCNLFAVEMFDALFRLTGETAWIERADALRRAVYAFFWSPEKQCLLTRRDDGRTHELVQLLGLYTGAVPEEKRRMVLDGILAEKHLRVTPSSMPYLVRVLAEGPREAQLYLESRIEREFYPMLAEGSTTVWETAFGQADFNNAGSLCHGWSAVAVYYYHACVLGVRPEKPGFAEIRRSPVATARIRSMRGEIVTPSGRLVFER